MTIGWIKTIDKAVIDNIEYLITKDKTWFVRFFGRTELSDFEKLIVKNVVTTGILLYQRMQLGKSYSKVPKSTSKEKEKE